MTASCTCSILPHKLSLLACLQQHHSLQISGLPSDSLGFIPSANFLPVFLETSSKECFSTFSCSQPLLSLLLASFTNNFHSLLARLTYQFPNVNNFLNIFLGTLIQLKIKFKLPLIFPQKSYQYDCSFHLRSIIVYSCSPSLYEPSLINSYIYQSSRTLSEE